MAELTPRSYSQISDLPLALQVELDRKAISFRMLLDLVPGSVVPLSRPAGENVDIYIGELYLGGGEILLTDARLAVRVAELGHPNISEGDRATK